MVSDLVERGLVDFQDAWVEPDKLEKIETAATQLGLNTLTPVKESLPPEFTYDEIRLVVAYLRRRRDNQSMAAAT